jgi:hypothetical protein
MDNDLIRNNLPGIAQSLTATIIWMGGVVAFFRFRRWISKKIRFWAVIEVQAIVGTALVLVLGFQYVENTTVRVGVTLIVSLIVMAALQFILSGYKDLGIGSAYSSTEKGVGFRDSLDLARNSLDFLGIGGHKLTENIEAFEAAMKRCAVGGKSVRLLLSDPKNPLLAKLALRNDKKLNAYARNVTDSLRKIAKVKFDSDLNIEVRFYPHQTGKDFQNFRLMFIDGSICLWSWTVWGAAMGRDNPQIILHNKTRDAQSRAAYHAFQDYFNRLWEDELVEKVDLMLYRTDD